MLDYRFQSLCGGHLQLILLLGDMLDYRFQSLCGGHFS